MLYRIANEQDVAALVRMRWEFDQEDGYGPPQTDYDQFARICGTFLKQNLADGKATFWVAEDAGEIVAHIFIYRISSVPRPSRLEGSYGYITNVYTKPAYRNQGIGTALMQRALAWAKSHDLSLLIVSPSERSIPFYRRAGFADESEFMQITLQTN